MGFVRNAWYVACWSADIADGKLLNRRLLDEPVVFYRKQGGTVVALQDRCPHRFIPLSQGKLVGDQIECIYHGLRFDYSGSCVRNPHGDGRIPPAAKVRAYPVHERWGMVWIWMGDSPADLARLPDYGVLDHAVEGFTISRGYVHIAAQYELMGENLLDLSHITYLHDGYLGSPEQVGADQTVSEQDGKVSCNRWMPNISVPSIFNMVYRRDGKPVDMWTNMTWMPPSCFLLDTGVHEVGGQREDHGWYYGIHILTPESASTTHYHFAACMPPGTSLSPDEAREFATLRRYAFESQDKPILDLQQAAFGGKDFWDMKPVLLSIDSGPIKMRRQIERLLEQEAQAAPR